MIAGGGGVCGGNDRLSAQACVRVCAAIKGERWCGGFECSSLLLLL